MSNNIFNTIGCIQSKMIQLESLYDGYTFYIEYCVDEDKGEIPLSFEEWKREQGKE